ncbi:MAG: hypothetical protein ABIP28_13415 [Mucilaginibacter sp.]
MLIHIAAFGRVSSGIFLKSDSKILREEKLQRFHASRKLNMM